MKREDLKAVAHHEAGHVLAFILSGIRFQYVTIKAKRGSYTGMVKHRPHFHTTLSKSNFVQPPFFYKRFRWDFIYFAGSTAELMYNKAAEIESGESDSDIMKTLLTCSDLPDALQEKYIQFLAAYTSEALIKDWRKIEIIAKALIEKETLSYDEITNIIYK